MGTHFALARNSLLEHLTRREGGKSGKENRRKTKGGAPRAPTKPKGGKARTRGRRGGEEKEPS